MGLKIDYISDLHMGFVIGNKRSSQHKVMDKISKFVESTLPEDLGEALVIAGDVDEYNTNIIYTFEEYAKYYDKIFFVYGNHDLYLLSQNQQTKYHSNSRNKQEELKKRVNDHNTLKEIVTILDNDIVNYKGKTIAGTMLWYTLPLAYDQIWWGVNSNDSRKIYPRGHEWSEERHKIDIAFYKSLEDMSVDLIITHVPPAHLNDVHRPSASYHNVAVSDLGLYADHWICGHQHVRKIEKVGDTFIYVNASGYTGELVGESKIKQFDI